MRAALAGLAALAACSVPDKQLAGDAGTDGLPVDPGGAPETTLTAAPPEFSREPAATFRFEADDPAATFECSVDGESPVPCSSPYVRTLGDGAHGFAVRAVDVAGNRDASPAEHLWSIDTVAPETLLTEAPPAADNSVEVRFEFASDERQAAFECSLDGAGYQACDSGDTFGPVGDGAHSFAVRARDRAGNVDASPAIHAWSVDTSTPDTQLLSGPEGATASTSASFTFVSPDAGPGATFECALDGAAFAACGSPASYASLAAGTHAFAVRVRDAVGNLDPTPATRTWTIDLTPPDTAITAGPEGVIAAASAIFTFTASEPGVTYACRIDGAPFAPCSSPFEATGLAQGPHAFDVRATDAAGHADPTPARRTWTVDTVAPEVAIVAGPAEAATTGPFVRFEFTASEGAVTCSLDGAGFAACASPLELSLPARPHQVVIRAIDEAGNTGSATRAFTVACAAPEPTGAAGLLHLDDAGQVLANAVAGGASATLGDAATVEPADPASVAGRFGRALAFTAAEGDRVAWPAALPAGSAFTLEVWARPEAVAGTRVLVATADGRVALRVTAVSPTMVRFAAAIASGPGPQLRVLSSPPVAAAAWHHVLASLEPPVLRLWVDAAPAELDGVQPGDPLAFDGLRLGGDYQGALDEVWLAQTPITAGDAARARYCPP